MEIQPFPEKDTTRRIKMWHFQMVEDPQIPHSNLGYIARYIHKYLSFPDKRDVLMGLGQLAFTKRTLTKWEAEMEGQGDFESILESLDGLKYVSYSRRTDDARDEKSFWWPHEEIRATLESLTWIPRTAIPVVQVFSYYQLDASFYVFHPYVYVVPTFVVHNTGYPLGLIIGRSESAELFYHLISGITAIDNFFGFSGNMVRKFKSMPCLSDKGTGLEKFCRQNQIRQFYCHRHIIEEFGSSSIYGLICRMILQTENLAEFRRQVAECNAMLYCWKESHNVPDQIISKYCNLTNQKLEGQELVWRSTSDDELQVAIAPWAIWLRGDVANTTNIQESFHGKMNGVVKKNSKKGKKCFCNNLRLVTKEITRRQECFGRTVGRNLKDSFAKYCGSRKILKELEDRAKEAGKPEGFVCPHCHVGVRMRCKWNTDTMFPCKHVDNLTAVRLFQSFEASVKDGLKRVQDRIDYSMQMLRETGLDEMPMAVSYCQTRPQQPIDRSAKATPIHKGTPIGHSSFLTPQEQIIAKLGGLIWATLGEKGVQKAEVYLMVATHFASAHITANPTPQQLVTLYEALKERLPKRKT